MRGKRESVSEGYSTGFTLDKQICVKRGDLVVISGQNKLNNEDLKIIKTIVNAEKIETILVGDYNESDLSYSLNISDINPLEDNLNMVERLLKDKRIID